MKSAVQQAFVYGSPSRQRGLAMVEFAIGLPVLLLLLMAVGEFGRMLFYYSSIQQSSRDAVRYLSREVWNENLGRLEIDPAVEKNAKHLAVYGVPGCMAEDGSPRPCEVGSKDAAGRCAKLGDEVVPCLGFDDVTISSPDADRLHVQVRVSYRFQPVVGSILPSLFGGADIQINVPLVAATVMRAM